MGTASECLNGSVVSRVPNQSLAEEVEELTGSATLVSLSRSLQLSTDVVIILAPSHPASCPARRVLYSTLVTRR